jgi:hypothetical protein
LDSWIGWDITYGLVVQAEKKRIGALQIQNQFKPVTESTV